MQNGNDIESLAKTSRFVNPAFCEYADLMRRLIRAGLARVPHRSLTDDEIRAIEQHKSYERRNGHRQKRPRRSTR